MRLGGTGHVSGDIAVPLIRVAGAAFRKASAAPVAVSPTLPPRFTVTVHSERRRKPPAEGTMKMLLFWTGICSLVLAGAWTYFTLAVPSVHLLAWAGFTGWASHFAAGGGPTGLKKALASTVSGGIWALIALNVYS